MVSVARLPLSLRLDTGREHLPFLPGGEFRFASFLPFLYAADASSGSSFPFPTLACAEAGMFLSRFLPSERTI